MVSAALEGADIDAVLSGGGAVTLYSDNEYMSADLDFVTSERNKTIAPVLESLGFQLKNRCFVHPATRFIVEFPPGPLAFGNRYVDNDQATTLETEHGPVRIITPTQCVMDRLSWFVHGGDLQSRDQALMVARRHQIDWDELFAWSRKEGIAENLIHEVREEAEGS